MQTHFWNKNKIEPADRNWEKDKNDLVSFRVSADDFRGSM